jgi:hypothetical protein
MAEHNHPSTDKETGYVNIYEQEFCLVCNKQVLKHRNCTDPEKCLNYIKAQLEEENNNNNDI